MKNYLAELTDCWRALAGDHIRKGWLSIPLGGLEVPLTAAGRHFPGNEEALLLGFSGLGVTQTRVLPQAKGFEISSIEPEGLPKGPLWLAITRKPNASIDLFSRIATDLLETMVKTQPTAPLDAFQCFLGRVRAWQAFLDKEESGALSRDAQVGLMGELCVLARLLERGIPPYTCVESWQGPIRGVQDFRLGTGAIEVKTSLAESGFSARIDSLDQLDDTVVAPIFLAAVRLGSTGGNTRSLKGVVDGVRCAVLDDLAAWVLLEERLLHAGFTDDHADKYTATYWPAEILFYLVNEDFPSLTRARVPAQVSSATYSITLTTTPKIEDLGHVLNALGAI